MKCHLLKQYGSVLLGLFLAAGAILGAEKPNANRAGTIAQEVLAATGIRSGLIVHLGCGDGTLTAELAGPGKYLIHGTLTAEQTGPQSFLVHGLSHDAATVEEARETIQSRGIYGQVSVEQNALKRLPYASNLANVVVADNLPKLLSTGLLLKEAMRVLQPRGIAYLGGLPENDIKSKLDAAGIRDFEVVKSGLSGLMIRKPRPKGMGEWTHRRCHASGNPVSEDTAAAPTQVQWAVEKYSKESLVRTLPVKPETFGPSACVIGGGRIFTAYTGTPYGSKNVQNLHRNKDFVIARDAFNGLFLWSRPINLPDPFDRQGLSRLYSRSAAIVDDRLYWMLPSGLVAYDAASGKIIKNYKVKGNGFLCHKGSLVVWGGTEPVMALDKETGKVLWKSEVRGAYAVAGDGKVFVAAGKEGTVAFDILNGKKLWGSRARDSLECAWIPTMAYHKGVLVIANYNAYNFSRGHIHGLSAQDGRLLWSHMAKGSGHALHLETFIAHGLVWVLTHSRYPIIGLDPVTGREIKRISAAPGMMTNYGRCHPSAASQRFILTVARHMLDWRNGKTDRLPGARALCKLGYRVANGLVYMVPRGSCRCYKGLGSVYLAYAPPDEPAPDKVDKMVDRFRKGPAYGNAEALTPVGKEATKETQATNVASSSEIKEIWQVNVSNAPAALTKPVIAGDTIYVAAQDRHQVSALDVHTGKRRWSYTAGGRPTWPVTIYPGLCLFGSRDGWMHCLRSSDGALAWRFRAAPRERLVVSSGQIESAWPVGPALLSNGVVYFAAGMASELEGGISVYGADPKTGEIFWSEECHGTERYNAKAVDAPPSTDQVVVGTTLRFPKQGEGIVVGSRAWRHFEPAVERKGPSQGRKKYPRHRTDAYIDNGTLHTGKLGRKATLVLSADMKIKNSSAALILGKTLVFAGPTHDGKGMLLTFSNPRKPALLAKHPLEAAPAWRGMTAADGKLYISLTNGKLLCVGGK